MKYPKIFFNDYFIQFGNDSQYQVYQDKLLKDFLENPNHNLQIKVDDQKEYHWAWKEMLKFLEPIEAAGGLIKNSNNQFLMIFRLGKWDLPKGKIDNGESPEQTAIREIEEEVNIPKNLLEIKKFIGLTYHIYSQKKQFMIKTTYWYEVFCSGDNTLNLKPQLEEDIQKIGWFVKKELFQLDTYPSIKSIFEIYFQ